MLNDAYTVEKLVVSRVRKGTRQFLIKWAGYGSEESTWEDESRILDRSLVAAFERRQAGKQNEHPKQPVVAAKKVLEQRPQKRGLREVDPPAVSRPSTQRHAPADSRIQGIMPAAVQ